MQHFFNMQTNAILSVLAFLGTGFGLFVAALAMMFCLVTRRLRWAKIILALALGATGLYAVTLLAFSLSSREQVLRPQEEKYFCEVDCHLAYSVEGVTTTKTLGKPPNQSAAQGMFYVVILKVRFEEKTISPHRGNAPLTPNPREVFVIDDTGRRFEPSLEGQRALEAAEGKLTPLTQPLRPGESYTTKLAFDLPADAKNLRLLLVEADWVARLLIGRENSFLHKKTVFLIEPQAAAVTHDGL